MINTDEIALKQAIKQIHELTRRIHTFENAVRVAMVALKDEYFDENQGKKIAYDTLESVSTHKPYEL